MSVLDGKLLPMSVRVEHAGSVIEALGSPESVDRALERFFNVVMGVLLAPADEDLAGTKYDWNQGRQLWIEGKSVTEIALTLGCSYKLVMRMKQEQEWPEPEVPTNRTRVLIDWDVAEQLWNEGNTLEQIAAELGCSANTLYNGSRARGWAAHASGGGGVPKVEAAQPHPFQETGHPFAASRVASATLEIPLREPAEPAPGPVSPEPQKKQRVDWVKARELWDEGMRPAEIARTVGCASPSIWSKAGVEKWPRPESWGPKKIEGKRPKGSRQAHEPFEKPDARPVPTRVCTNCGVATAADQACVMCGEHVPALVGV